MAADDYGLNFGLKPSQRTPSPAAIKRRQRRQKRTVDAANKTIDRLARNPGLAATRSLLSVSSALHPDNPYYANTLDQLNQTVSGIPGVQPDAAAAMVAGSITPDSKAGSELVSLQNQQQLQQNLQDLKLQQIKREAAQASEEARVAAENNSPLGYVKALSQVSFNALDFIHQVEMNAIRQAINTEDDMANPLLSFATALAKGETYANTDLGLNIMGGLDYITTGKLNDSQLDMGDGFLPEPESPVLKLKKSWDQQMMGTAGRNMRTIELEQPDGTIVRQIVDDSPATPGQWVASDVFDFDIGTRPYQIMSGTLDAGSYLLDPSMYLTARGITAGFVKAENALLRKPLGMEAHPTAADLTTAMEAGQAIRVGDQAASQVTEAQRRAQASQEALAENQAKIDEARQAWQLLNGAIADARSPEARAAAQEAASAAARETMTPAAREVAEAATAESQARQADLIAEEQADRIREVSDATLANARQQHGKLYTPRQEAAEGAVRAVERSDGKFDLIHASGARIAERDTLEEATSLADELSRMPGYDPQRTIDQVEAWDYVVDRATRNGFDAAQTLKDSVTTWDRANKNRRSDQWFEGGNADVDALQAFDRAAADGAVNLPAHGMSKAGTLTDAVDNLLDIVRNGLDPNRGRALADGTPRLDTASLATTQRGGGAGAGTASGSAYRDGPFILVAAEGGQLAGKLDDLRAVLVNPAHEEIIPLLQQALDAIRPGLKVDSFRNADSVTKQIMGKAEEAAPAADDAARAPGNYHGAAREFGDFGPAEEFSVGQGRDNVLGPGFHVTDSPEVAQQYVQKNKLTYGKAYEQAVNENARDPVTRARELMAESADGEGVVYRVIEREPVRFYDVTKPVAADDPALDFFRATFGDEYAQSAVDEGRSVGSMLDDLKEQIRSTGGGEGDLTEAIQSLIARLKDKGYGGFLDNGGRGTRHDNFAPHQVKVYWDPANQVTKERVDPASLRPDAAPAADAPPGATDEAARTVPDAAPAADAPPGATDEAARTVEDNPAGTATAANIDQLLAQRDNLEQSLTELSQLRDELVSYGDSVAIHLERSEQFARAQAKLLADQMKKSKLIKGEREPASDELDDVLEFLRDPAGIGDKSGVNGVNVDRALGFITNSYNGGWVALLDSFAAIKDPAILQEATNGKLGAEALRDLAEASNQQQVRMALAKHMARPDALSVNMGRLRGLKIAAQAKYGQDLDRVVSRYGKLFGHTALNSVSWGKQIKRAAVPWSQARHIEDEDGVLDLVFDHITYALSMNRPVSRGKGVGFSDKGGTGRRAFEGKEPELDANGIPVVDQAGQPVMKSEFEDVEYQSALEFRREWVRQFVNAKTGQERRALWNRLNSELVDRAADIQGLPYQLRQQFKDALRLSKMDAKNYTKYNTTTRAEIRDNQLYLDGELVADDFAAMEAQMSDFLLAPDWEEMRRAMTSAKAVLETGGVVGTGRDLINEITGTVFERYWRTSVIAFRGAYLIRNMADIQFRMYMAGHPSLLTNPLGITALATSHLAAPSGSLGRALNKMGDKVAKSLSKMKIGDTDLLGRSFYDELEPDVASYLRTYVGSEVDEYASNAFQTIVAQRHSHADPGTGAPQRRQTIAYEDIQAPAAGTKVSAANRYFDGWEFELGLLRRSPMAMMAFDVTYGGEIPAFLRKFAGADQSEPQRALVAWLINDKEGRKILDRARDGSGEIRKLTGDPDIDNGEMLYRWLFGDGPGSMMSQWRRLTLDGDPALVKAVRQPKPEKQEDFWQQRRDTRNLIKQRVSDPSYGFVADGVFTQERLPVGAVLADIVHEQKTSKFWQRYDGLVNGFFDASSRFEYAAGYLPEFRFYKWDRAAELAALLSPEDAAKLLDNAKAALGTKHAPNAWAAKTLRRLERGTKNAKGGGAFTLDDLDYATNVMAAKNVKELFYDARNRNQFANSVRLLAPFAQPWANTMIQWTKLAAQNPGRIYAAGVLFTAAQGRNSNWLQDDPMSPNDAFFYRDPKTRQLTVGVPAMGPAIGMLANLNPVDNARELTGGTSVNVDPSLVNSGIQLQSMNLLFQDGLLPGAGPVVTLSAGMLERFGWYRSSVPDVVKDFMIGSVNADPDADPTVASTVLPAWLQGILGSLGLRDWAPKMEKYMPHAMAALSQVNPDNRYYSVSPQGDIQQSDAQRAAFVMDSEHYAASMLFGRSLVQNVAPGAPMVNQLMVMDDGRIMAQAKLSQEYLSTLRESGDKTQALTTLLERYGTDAVFAILPTRGSSITPTNNAYQFLRNNPGKAEKFGPVLGLIFPEGGYSARMDRYQRQTSNNPKLSADETAKYINSYMKDAAQAQIDKRYIAGELTREQYEAESSGLTKSYEEAGARMPNYGNFGEDAAAWRAGLLDAASDPDLMEADKGGVLKAVKQYEEYRTHAQQRSGNESFGSVEMTEWRAWLRKKGGELIQQYPSFRVAWTKVYENEVEETLR